MNISYSNELKKKLKDDAALSRYYPQLQEKIRFVLSILSVVKTLKDVPTAKPLVRHKLTGKDKNNWAVWINANYRLIFTPTDKTDDEDISKIEDITLLRIEDYH